MTSKGSYIVAHQQKDGKVTSSSILLQTMWSQVGFHDQSETAHEFQEMKIAQSRFHLLILRARLSTLHQLFVVLVHHALLLCVHHLLKSLLYRHNTLLIWTKHKFLVQLAAQFHRAPPSDYSMPPSPVASPVATTTREFQCGNCDTIFSNIMDLRRHKSTAIPTMCQIPVSCVPTILLKMMNAKSCQQKQLYKAPTAA